MVLQNCRVDIVDGRLVITILDIHAELGLNAKGNMKVAFGNISHGNISGTMNAYRSRRRALGGHRGDFHGENIEGEIRGNQMILRIVDMNYRRRNPDGTLKRTPKGHLSLGHCFQTIDHDLTIQYSPYVVEKSTYW